MSRRASAGRIVACAGLVTSAAVIGAVVPARPAFADATAPPPFSSLKCPAPAYPPKDTFYGVPFRAIIFSGQIKLPPSVLVPHLFASACGLVHLPQLSGSIDPSGVQVATPNVYIGTTPAGGQFSALEALPASVSFKSLSAAVALTAAPNGGLDLTLTADTLASVTTLGFTCQLPVRTTFTTRTDGPLTGAPVTGPTRAGQAAVVSQSFPVGAVVGSDRGTCPPSVAQTFDQLLGLPSAPGVASFTAPFCFEFELDTTRIPAPTAACPWPAS